MTSIKTWIDEYHKGSRFGLNGDVVIKKKSQILLKNMVLGGKVLMRFLKS